MKSSNSIFGSKVVVVLALVAAGLFSVALSGCGEETARGPLGPTSEPTITTPRVVAFEPVPTELVLALDVSDSTDADELGAMVDALVAVLGDADVFDQSGSASIAVLAYGDTTVGVVDTLTVLDGSSLESTFVSALEGLESDRGTAGSAAVLDEALAEAATLLAAGATVNQHVLVIGSGKDVDGSAVESRCADLAAAGVRVHAVGLGVDDTARTLLEGCAEATGGRFVELADAAGLSDAVRDVLARATVVQLRLVPDTAELDRGAEHVVTATVTRGIEDDAMALEGLAVVFEVTEGPSAGAMDTVLTDAEGQASFSLVGDVPPGTDTIEARVDHPDGEVVLVAAVEVVWTNQAPACDAGGPYAATVEGDTVRVMLDASASSDPEGDPLSFAWTVDGEGLALEDADSSMATLLITGAATCADTLEVMLEVGDGFDTSSCTARVVLDDMRAPMLMPREDTVELWPVNHRLHVITPDMTLEAVEDACGDLDLSDVVVLSVTSDEAFDARGSGNTSPDVFIACDGSVQLRAERAGGGDGRVYTIEYAVSDADGNTTTTTVEVHVPHDQSGRSAVAGEVVETVFADCDGTAR